MSVVVYEALISHTLQGLRAMAHHNTSVSTYLFSHMAILLSITVAMEHLAVILKEVT